MAAGAITTLQYAGLQPVAFTLFGVLARASGLGPAFATCGVVEAGGALVVLCLPTVRRARLGRAAAAGSAFHQRAGQEDQSDEGAEQA